MDNYVNQYKIKYLILQLLIRNKVSRQKWNFKNDHVYCRGTLKLIFVNKKKNDFKIILNKCYYLVFILGKEYKTAFLTANVFLPLYFI